MNSLLARFSKLALSLKFQVNGLRAANYTYLVAILFALISTEISLFSLHPLLMALSWVLVTEGVLSFRRKRAGAVNRHFIFVSIAIVLVVAAFAIIYTTKNENNKPHFQTYRNYLL
jgi:ABC-type nickel/cobalt efflux system permease component RcnA